jgi:hypothetical protein
MPLMRPDAQAPARPISWREWCGHDPRETVLIALRDGNMFAPKHSLATALTVWRAREVDLVDSSARLALARLVARRIGQTDEERALLLRVLTECASGTAVETHEAPSPPSPDEIARSLAELPRSVWAEHLNAVRLTFYAAHDTAEEFAVWLLRELWRRGAAP